MVCAVECFGVFLLMFLLLTCSFQSKSAKLFSLKLSYNVLKSNITATILKCCIILELIFIKFKMPFTCQRWSQEKYYFTHFLKKLNILFEILEWSVFHGQTCCTCTIIKQYIKYVLRIILNSFFNMVIVVYLEDKQKLVLNIRMNVSSSPDLNDVTVTFCAFVKRVVRCDLLWS